MCDALVIGSEEAWDKAALILAHRLTESERALLALAALIHLPDEVAGLVSDCLDPAPEPVDPRITEAAIEYRRSQGLPNFGGAAA
ncbi:hypothetical protein [Poseidonocella sp. HB161398]|uniref:hypothetical protein n=1 Tax=Poseidonocella sp. HB161398 TaxID=2320855 RepID=UPI0011094E2C|nr:hypothetical protein [Poseidonocella sp. HB161398]